MKTTILRNHRNRNVLWRMHSLNSQKMDELMMFYGLWGPSFVMIVDRKVRVESVDGAKRIFAISLIKNFVAHTLKA